MPIKHPSPLSLLSSPDSHWSAFCIYELAGLGKIAYIGLYTAWPLCLASFAQDNLRLSCGVAFISAAFLFGTEYYSVVRIYHILFIHLSVKWLVATF